MLIRYRLLFSIIIVSLIAAYGVSWAAPPPQETERAAITAENATNIVLLGAFSGTRPRMNAIAFRPGSTQLAASGSYLSEPDRIRLYDWHTGEVQIIWESEEAAVERMAFHPSGDILAYHTELAAHVLIIDEETVIETTIYEASGDTDLVRSVAFSPNGLWLALGRVDGAVLILDTASFEQAATLEAPRDDVANAMIFSPDSTVLVVGHRIGIIRLWDMTVAEPIEAQVLGGHGETNTVYDLAFNPDGTLLASAGKDRTVRVWDIESGEEHAHFDARTRSVDFSPDGTLLAAGDKTLHIWDVASGEQVYRYFHSDRAIRARYAIFSPDGTFLVSGNQRLSAWGLDATGLDALGLIEVEDDRIYAAEEVFRRAACSTCHLDFPSAAPWLRESGQVAATRIEGMSAEDYLFQSIIDPDAYVEPGYARGIHPTHYASTLNEEEVWLLVEYILHLAAEE